MGVLDVSFEAAEARHSSATGMELHHSHPRGVLFYAADSKSFDLDRSASHQLYGACQAIGAYMTGAKIHT